MEEIEYGAWSWLVRGGDRVWGVELAGERMRYSMELANESRTSSVRSWLRGGDRVWSWLMREGDIVWS